MNTWGHPETGCTIADVGSYIYATGQTQIYQNK